MKRLYFLEGFTESGHQPQRFELARFPATVGRDASSTVQLSRGRISRHHARLDQNDSTITVTDLGSTNGTFVNRERIGQPVEVLTGDLISFAGHEFRLTSEPASSVEATLDIGSIQSGLLAGNIPLPNTARAFHELLEARQVKGEAQVICCPDGSVFAMELLGRGTHPELPESPSELFAIAEALGEEIRLSRLFREQGLERAAEADLRHPLFINTHPAESRDADQLLDHLGALQKCYPGLELVLEVHETVVTDLSAMARVHRRLEAMGIGLAYDDFGAGQARLLELAEVPPEYLKFDLRLVKNLTSEGSNRFRLLDNLQNMIAELGVRTIAEGIERRRTAELCQRIGVDYLQGFLLGRPRAIG